MTVPGEAQQRAERIEEIRADLDKPIQSQFIREDVRFLLAEIVALVERVEAAERDRDVVAEGMDVWRSRALVAEKRLEARVAELEEERDNAIAAFNEQCARLDAIEEIVAGVPVAEPPPAETQ